MVQRVTKARKVRLNREELTVVGEDGSNDSASKYKSWGIARRAAGVRGQTVAFADDQGMWEGWQGEVEASREDRGKGGFKREDKGATQRLRGCKQ